MAFYLKRWLDEMAARLRGLIHRYRSFSDQRITLIMLVKCKKKILLRITVFFAVLVEAFDRFSQDASIKLVRIMLLGGARFCTANIKQKATEAIDLVEEPKREPAKLWIFGNIGYSIEACPLLLPNGGMCTGAVNFERKKFLFALVEPSAESPHFIDW
ncbi:hypothetical protein A9D60_17445 [Leisingera sp. JC1]|nr:hypothetical protein A9D60_17445 [Leisingera sp. JC1]